MIIKNDVDLEQIKKNNEEKNKRNLLYECEYYKFKELLNNCLYCVDQNYFSKVELLSLKPNFNGTCGIASSIYTLKLLDYSLMEGDFIDFFVLTRKIRDNLFFNFFLLDEMNYNYKIDYQLFLDTMEGKKDANLFIKSFLDDNKDIFNTKNQKALINFFKSELSDNEKNRIVKYSYYKNYFNDNNKINKCLYLKELEKRLDKNLNDFVHSNGIMFLSNEMLIRKYSYKTLFKKCSECIKNLLFIFIIYIFFINPTLFGILDLEDYIDQRGMVIDGMQYEVSKCIKCAISELKKESKETYDFLIKNNDYSMRI